MEKRERWNFFLAVTGGAVSLFGTMIYTFAIGLYVLKLTGSGMSFGLTLMLGTLPRVLLGPFTGNWADRLSKKAIVVISDLFSGVLMLGMMVYATQVSLTLPMIYLATVLLSISSTFLQSAFGAASVEIVRKDTLTRFGAANHSCRSIIDLISPIIGGLIYAIVPIYVFLLINGISFILSALSEFFIDFKFNRVSERTKTRNSFFADFRARLAYFRDYRIFLNIAFMALFLNFFLTSIGVVMPFGLVNVMGVSEKLYGAITAILSVGSLAGAIIVGRLNLVFSKRHLMLGLTLLGISFLGIGGMLHSGIPWLWLSLGGVTLFGFLLTAAATSLNIPLGVYLQTSVDPAYLGRVLSILGTLASGISPIAFILFGFLTGYLSPFTILFSCGLITVGIIILSGRSRAFDELKSVTKKDAEVNTNQSPAEGA